MGVIADNMERFDPRDFFLTTKYVGTTRGNRALSSRCYVGIRGNGVGGTSMVLSIPNAVGKKIVEEIGEYVDFSFKDDGTWFLWPGTSRKFSYTNKKSKSVVLSVTLAKSDYVEKMGKFNHLYLRVDRYGNHVRLIPTGERD